MKNGAVRIGWHNALQDLPAKHPRIVKIKRSIISIAIFSSWRALLALRNCTVAHAQNNNNFSGKLSKSMRAVTRNIQFYCSGLTINARQVVPSPGPRPGGDQMKKPVLYMYCVGKQKAVPVQCKAWSCLQIQSGKCCALVEFLTKLWSAMKVHYARTARGCTCNTHWP